LELWRNRRKKSLSFEASRFQKVDALGRLISFGILLSKGKGGQDDDLVGWNKRESLPTLIILE